jgi:hypothetical protein
MEASSLSLTKRNMSIYEDACKQIEWSPYVYAHLLYGLLTLTK